MFPSSFREAEGGKESPRLMVGVKHTDLSRLEDALLPNSQERPVWSASSFSSSSPGRSSSEAGLPGSFSKIKAAGGAAAVFD